MSSKNYLMINKETNVCDNIVLWNGNPETWTPPADYLMMELETVKPKVWVWNVDTKEYELQVADSGIQIGFTWDGTNLITNEDKPVIVEAPNQPNSTGTQTL
jgi:hypothetical protein